jgi:hypothetical protein
MRVVRTAPPRTLLSTLRPRRVLLLPLVAGIATFATVYTLDAFLAYIKLPAEATFLDDTLLAILVALLVISLELDHAKELRAQQHKIAVMQEMNHHIRNALQSISYLTFNIKDQEVNAKLQEAMARIEWALREVLPSEPGIAGDDDPDHRSDRYKPAI